MPGSPWAETIGRLRCLRGIDTLSAVGLCAEVGDWTRFPKAGHVMSYLGLVPSEDTTGSSRRLGAITKTGSGTAAGCWSRRPGTTAAARSSTVLKRRQAGQPAHVIAISWQAQRRLHRTGSAWTASAVSAARSSPSLSRASSPASAGPRRTPTDPACTTSVKEAAGTSRHSRARASAVPL